MSSNPALETKAKAMGSELLTEADYRALIEAETLSDVVNYLKTNTQYQKYLENIDSEKARRSDLETAFSKVILSETEKLLYFVNGSDKEFLRLSIMKSNLMNLLVLLRALAVDEPLTQIVKRLCFSDHFSQIDIDKLLNVDSFAAFKDALKKTYYYRAIEAYEYVNNEDLFSIEKTMERTFYDLLYRRVKKLTRAERNLKKTIRFEIDLLNILWLYRAKKFYHLTSEEIIPYVYQGGYYLNEEELTKLSNIEDFNEFLSALKEYRAFDFLFEGGEETMDTTIERRIKRYLHAQFQRLFFFGDSLSTAYSYLRLLEDEQTNIIAIIEAKRYDLSEKEVLEYLI